MHRKYLPNVTKITICFHPLQQIFGGGSSWWVAGDAFCPVRFHSLQHYRALWGKERLIPGGVWLLFPLYLTFLRVWWKTQGMFLPHQSTHTVAPIWSPSTWEVNLLKVYHTKTKKMRICVYVYVNYVRFHYVVAVEKKYFRFIYRVWASGIFT